MFVSRQAISLIRKVGGVTALTITGAALIEQARQNGSKISDSCSFTKHTSEQRKLHPYSGMHAPYISEDEILKKKFEQFFSEYSHLMPSNLADFQKQQSLQLPVQIRPLIECPVALPASNRLLAVGGPPALITASISEREVFYLNDERKWPIANGSAWHLEEDVSTQSLALTSPKPLTFMLKQAYHTLVRGKTFHEIEETGIFSWQAIDWVGFARHPEQWLAAGRVALHFQFRSNSDGKTEEEKISRQCRFNEHVYNDLNQRLDGKLLLPGFGSIIVARNALEVKELYKKKEALSQEGRELQILSKSELMRRFGFTYNGLLFAEKTHDRILSPFYKQMLSKHLIERGGTVMNGTLLKVYTNDQHQGGVAQFRLPDGRTNYVSFGQLVMSLGAQDILDINNKPLFDLISATGTAGLALIYVPRKCILPRASVFGGTNHCTIISQAPLPVFHKNQQMNLYLARITAGACIAPAYRGVESGHYDGKMALGLISAVRNALGSSCIVEILTMHGCNRSVSKHGQTDWLQPYPGIHIQYGAGGGGLTRAANKELIDALAEYQTGGERPQVNTRLK